jgi:hypothetical protein
LAATPHGFVALPAITLHSKRLNAGTESPSRQFFTPRLAPAMN